MKILIILNTSYHSEVALSLYGSLRLLNLEPYIYPIYSDKDYGLIDLCIKYNINYLEKYDSSLKDIFEKAFLITPITGGLDLYNQSQPCTPPCYDHPVVQDFKSKMILLIHRPTRNTKFIKYASNVLFENPKFIGLSPFSQQINLNYILLSENPVANQFPIKNKLNDIIKFLIIGRFDLHYRDFPLLEKFLKNKFVSSNSYEVILLGRDSDKLRLENDKIIYKSNLTEINFYNELYSCDFIINLLCKSKTRGYFSDCTSSNFNHIFSFKKPAINCKFSSLVFPFPSFTYLSDEEYSTTMRQAINIKPENYSQMVDNFDITTKNIRLHNKNALETLLY